MASSKERRISLLGSTLCPRLAKVMVLGLERKTRCAAPASQRPPQQRLSSGSATAQQWLRPPGRAFPTIQCYWPLETFSLARSVLFLTPYAK